MDSSQVSVINPLFCAPDPIDLAFTTKPPGEKRSRNLAAVDAAGNVVFRAKQSSWGGYTQLRDASGHTILTIKAKFWSRHGRWQAFAGESTEAKDLLFSIKRSSVWQIHDEWFVFLAPNTTEENCDFKIVGSYRKKNYTIFKGDSSFVVAQLTKQHKLNMTLKHAFGASISANCDYSFVIALITIFHEIEVSRNAAAMNVAIRNATAAMNAVAVMNAAAGNAATATAGNATAVMNVVASMNAAAGNAVAAAGNVAASMNAVARNAAAVGNAAAAMNVAAMRSASC